MKTIAIDMDGVLADVYQQLIDMHYSESGITLKSSDMVGMTEAEAFPHLLKHVHTKGFFETVPLIPGGQEVVAELSKQYKIFIVSAATEFPLSLTEKHNWLNKHFPFISWQQMVFCGSKEIIKTDIMIDDHFKNLDVFDGKTFLFTQPHNEKSSPGKHERVNNWNEIKKILLG
ncbi:5' nucleotidase, NT5C type [Cyclobacterium qasimii]|uniref:5'(3')-deoxyribonucleotidase n=2 Tax=Cyclobacterium qasimii TaxID=1350429 RepID=A0A512C862_9BACT|nr:5'(3')-deoxyribonucleotidase [Cyclobacterium qasimii]GEO20394.1 5'(3')-deoxyribonucleotidase [Cyclobacterium qasimii]